MRYFFLCLLACCGIGIFAQKNKPVTDTRLAGLDTAFTRVLKDWKAAGFAIAVVEKNKVIYANGFGYKDYEKKLPATANTQFAIGSCTKAFTASLIGLLEADKKVDFDEPVRTYLPELKFFNNDMNDHVTLRDMMCHRTGVARYDYSWYYFPTDDVDSLIQRVQSMEPAEPLRRKWQYNNFMFMLQGAVTAKLSGKTWEDNVREKLFRPLGMTNSNVSLAEWMKAPDLAKGYGLKQDSLIDQTDYYNIRAMAPAGSINSSVTDMAKWVTMWINGGKYNGKQVIPAPYVNEAISAQMIMSGGLPDKDHPEMFMNNYGFGWMLSNYRGHYRVEHGGNIDGFSASTCFFPSDSIGIVVLCNQNGSSVPAMVRNLVSDKMLGLKYRDWETESFRSYSEGQKKGAAAAKTIVSDKVANTRPSHTLKDYAGLYTHNSQEQFEIIQKADSLFLVLRDDKLWLRHYHYDVFQLFDIDRQTGIDTVEGGGPKILFQTDESGKISSASLPLEPTSKPIEFTRTDKVNTIALSKDSLQKYVGDYTLAGTDVKVYLKGENTLYLFVPGQPEYELMNEDKHKFGIKGLKGFHVQFTLNDKNEATEVTFIQPNGTFKATRKVKI